MNHGRTGTKYAGFYSFKGGVGRTLALVGAAMELYRQGKRVLCVDTDLEAPGLTLMPDFKDTIAGKRGFIEVATETLNGNPQPMELTRIHLDRAVLVPRVDSGMLCVVGAGGALEEYGGWLDRFQEANLSKRKGAVENLRSMFEQTRAPDGEPFDFVFIDLRTGLSLLSTDLVDYLCDVLVVVSTLNTQNLTGTVNFVRSLEEQRAATPLGIIRVLSPGPNSEVAERDRRLATYRSELGEVDVEIPYSPALFYHDDLYTLRKLTLDVAEKHAVLAGVIRNRLDQGPIQHAEFLMQAIEAYQRAAAGTREQTQAYDNAVRHAREILLCLSPEDTILRYRYLKSDDVPPARVAPYLEAIVQIRDASGDALFELANIAVQRLRWAEPTPFGERILNGIQSIQKRLSQETLELSPRKRARLDIEEAIASLLVLRYGRVWGNPDAPHLLQSAREKLLGHSMAEFMPTDRIRRAMGLAYLANIEDSTDNLDLALDLLDIADSDIPSIHAWRATVLAHFARVAKDVQRTQLWESVLEAAAKNQSRDPAASWYIQACVHAQMNRRLQGLDALSHAVKARPDLMRTRALYDPDLAPLHGDGWEKALALDSSDRPLELAVPQLD